MDGIPYNERLRKQAWQSQRTVVGTHRGMLDFAVPVVSERVTRAVMLTGPLLPSPPTSAWVLEGWRSLTGRQGHPSDPEFARYLSMVLDTLVLDGNRSELFQRLLEHLASLMGGSNAAYAVATEVRALASALTEGRFIDDVWHTASAMVDPQTSGLWSTSLYEDRLPRFGLKRCPDIVAVGMVVNLDPDADPLDDFFEKRAMQRGCAQLALRTGNAISGQLGEYGVTLLGAFGRTAGGRRKLGELCDAAQKLARRHRLRVHFGLSALDLDLPAQYQAALGAAESALSENVAQHSASSATPPGNPLRGLRRELARLMVDSPPALMPRFEHFLDAVSVRTAHRLEPARSHLETAFESMTEPLLSMGMLDSNALRALETDLEKSARSARTLSDLYSSYRAKIQVLVDETRRPSEARQVHSLRRAEEFLSQHYTESVSLTQVARAAGFAPTYFSTLFHRTKGKTFERYLGDMRLSRAKTLLLDTSLSLETVARLSGFSRASYLSRVFKQRMNETPIDYRWRALHRRRPDARPGRKPSQDHK